MMCKDCKSWTFLRRETGLCENKLSPNFGKETHKSDICVPKKPVAENESKQESKPEYKGPDLEK